jgi:hypothetical protein
MAEMLAFPLSRRVGLIRKQGAWFVAQETRKGAERNLARLLEIQRQALVSKGVPAEKVEPQLKELEGAIRGHAWRLVIEGEVAG